MNKEKTLEIIEGAISDVKKDLDYFKEEKDSRGIYLNQGKLEQLLQLRDIIEAGRLDA